VTTVYASRLLPVSIPIIPGWTFRADGSRNNRIQNTPFFQKQNACFRSSSNLALFSVHGINGLFCGSNTGTKLKPPYGACNTALRHWLSERLPTRAASVASFGLPRPDNSVKYGCLIKHPYRLVNSLTRLCRLACSFLKPRPLGRGY